MLGGEDQSTRDPLKVVKGQDQAHSTPLLVSGRSTSNMKIPTALVLFALGTSADRDERHVIDHPTPTATPSPSPHGNVDTTVSDVRYIGPDWGNPFPGPLQYVRSCLTLALVAKQHHTSKHTESPRAMHYSSVRRYKKIVDDWNLCRVCENKVSVKCEKKCVCTKWREVKNRRKQVNPDGMFPPRTLSLFSPLERVFLSKTMKRGVLIEILCSTGP